MAVGRASRVARNHSLRVVVNHEHVSVGVIGNACGGRAQDTIEPVVAVASERDEVHVEIMRALPRGAVPAPALRPLPAPAWRRT